MNGMSDFWITTIGIGAALLTTGSWLPQVLKSWHSRSVKDFSWGYLVLLTAGISLWLAYGVFRRDLAIAGANAATLAFLAVLIGIKARERRRKKAAIAALSRPTH